MSARVERPGRGSTRLALRTILGGVRELLALRWIRVVLVLVALAVIARVSLEAVLARTLDRLASERSLTVSWADLDLSLLGGSGSVRGLVVRNAEDSHSGAPLLEVEFGEFDLDVLALLRGDLSVARAEIDGLDARLVRSADGRWNLGDHVSAAELLALFESDPDAEEPVEDEAPGGLRLDAPLAVRALRLQHATLHLADHAVEPPFEASAEASLRLSYLGAAERPLVFSATVTAGTAAGAPLLDGAVVQGTATTAPDVAHVELTAHMGGLRPRPLERYLAALDLRPIADEIGASARASIDLEVVGEARDALRCAVALAGLELSAGGGEALALDSARFEVERVAADGASLPAVALEGLRARAALELSGALRVAGLELLPRPAEPAPQASWFDALGPVLDLGALEELPRWAVLLARRDDAAYPWTLGALTVRGGLLEVEDRRVTPPALLPVHLDELAIEGVAHLPGQAPSPIAVHASLRSPGLAREIRVSGEVLPFAPRRRVDLSLDIEGLGFEGVEGYLQRAHVEQDFESADFSLTLVGEAETDAAGRTEGWLELREVGLTGVGELFGLRGLTARGLVVDPDERLLRLGDVEVQGPRVSIARDPSRHLVAFGLRALGFGGAAVAPPGAGDAPLEPVDPVSGGVGAPAPAAPVAAPGGPPPRLELGRLAWSNSDVSFHDEATDPPTSFEVEELGFVLEDLVLGGDPEGPEPPPARLTARLAAPGVVEALTVEGTVRSRPGRVDLESDLTVSGAGLSGALLAPYLAPLGVAPVLVDGALSLSFAARVRETDAGWSAGATAREVSLRDGEHSLLSAEELRLDGLRLEGDALAVAELVLVRPFASLARDADSSLRAGGVRVLLGGGPEGEPDAPPEHAAEPAAAALALPALPELRVDHVAVLEARLAWTDATLSPPVEVELVASADARALGTRGEAGSLSLSVALPGALDALIANAEFELSPEGWYASAELGAEGLRGGPLAAYLPPGLLLEAERGRFTATVELSAEPAPEGGLALSFEARDVAWGEPDGEPWLALDRAGLELSRVDPVARIVRVRGAGVAGLTVDATRADDGVLRALGLAFAAPPVEEPAFEEPALEEPAPVAVGDALPPLRIELESPLALRAERVRFRDATLGADARPLEAEVELVLEGPAVLLDPRPEELPPFVFRARAALAGALEELLVEGSCSPFADEPQLEATLSVRGLSTGGLLALAPALAGSLSGELEKGWLEGHLAATLRVRRARPTELGLARGFGAGVVLDGLALRDGEAGQVLLGLDRAELDIERVDTAKGLVHVEAIELETVRARVRRSDEGLHALGLRLPLGDQGAAEAPVAEDEVAAVEASAPVAAVPSENGSAGPAGEVRIDRLLVTGLDFVVEDATVDPPLVLAFDELDAELKRFTTRMLTEKRPVQLGLSVGAAPVGDGPPLFDELVLNGRVAVYPAPSGWVQMTLNGLELTTLAPLAAEQGVEIEDGALDVSTRVRLKGESGASVSTRLVFTDLDLEEQQGGPVESSLGLSMPLDAALFVLRNPAGEHRISVGFQVGSEGLGEGQVIAAATSAVSGVVAGALVGAPLRLLGGLLPGGDAQPKPAEVLTFEFAPGATELSADDAARLAALAERLRQTSKLSALVEHDLSAADLERATALANPSPETCLAIAEGLRQRKAELLRRRDEAELAARALVSLGTDGAADGARAVRQLERELAATEASLDELYEVARATSERQRNKRTRSTARELAELRVEAVEAGLRGALGSKADERLEVRSPRVEADPELPSGGRVVVELRRR